MALLPGSPAIDAGNNALIPAGVTTDQRGLPRIVNGTVDIGAFESSGFTIALTSGSGQTARSRSRPAGRDGHRQQPDRARGGGPGHIHPAGERSVGGTDGQPGDHQRQRHGERHGHEQRRSPAAYTVSATADGAAGAASFSLTNVALVSIAVSPGNPELPVGVSGQFTATGTYADGSTADITGLVTWASATPSVATISGTGVATALAPGTSAITASLDGRHQPRRHLDRDSPAPWSTPPPTNSVSPTARSACARPSRAPMPSRAKRSPSTRPFSPRAQTITLRGGQLELSNTTGTETITGPAAGVTVSARRHEPGVPGRQGCHRVDLGTDDHRRQRLAAAKAAACSTTARSR